MGPKFTRSRAGGPKGLKQQATSCDTLRVELSGELGYCGINRKDKNMKIEKNNFVVTFKTEKEVSDYIGMHIPEEQRLLWLGFFIANNYIAQKLEDDGIELVKKK